MKNTIVAQSGIALKYASSELRNCKEIVMTVLGYVSPELRINRDVMHIVKLRNQFSS